MQTAKHAATAPAGAAMATAAPSPVVAQIGAISFEGNIVPHQWFHHPLLRHENGKVNLVAITLLSDVLYWYRPTILRDEASGRIVEVRKKFAADKLQKSYGDWADLFGLTKRQVQDAVAFLKQRGILLVELRDVLTASGTMLRNAVFIEPVPEMIQRLCGQPAAETTADGRRVTLQRDTSPATTGDVSRYNGRRVTLQRGTYTETSSTKISTKNTAADRTGSPRREPDTKGAAAAVPREEAASPGELAAELIAAEVNRADALRLARDKPEECRRQLGFLPYVAVFKSGKGAYLRSAIEQGFGPPREWHEAKQAARQTEEQERKRAAAQEAARERRRVEAERATQLESARARFMADRQQWQQILTEAEQLLPVPLRGRSNHVAYGPALEASINRVVAQRTASS